MHSYPIWNEVNSCIYKGSKSYGARDTGEVSVYVGTSAKNSELLCRHVTTRRIDGEFTVFRFGVDVGGGGFQVMTEKFMHTKTKTWYDTDPRKAEAA